MFKSLSQQVYEGAMDNYEHRGLVLRPNCVPEKVGVNHNWYSDHKQGIRVTERSQPNGVKPKMRVCKLRGGVNRRGALKQKRRTTIGRKTRPTCSCCPINFKRDTFVKYSAWLPIFMFREQDSVPGNGYLVSVQYDNVTPAEEAARIHGHAVHCRTTTEVSENSPSHPVVSRNIHISSEAQLFSDPRDWFPLRVKKKPMAGCNVIMTCS